MTERQFLCHAGWIILQWSRENGSSFVFFLSCFFYLFNFSSWVFSKPRSLLLGPYRIHMMKCSVVIISADWQSSASPRRVADASEVLKRPLEAEEPASPGRASAVVADAKPSHFKTNHALRLQPPLHLPARLRRLIWWPSPVIVSRNYFYKITPWKMWIQ